MTSWINERGTRVLPIARGGTGNATGTATVNANLTGPITSVGNATAVAAQTGTGSTFVMSAGPTLTGTLTAAAITASSTITPSQTIGIVGTTTNNSVQAGSVGELLSTVVLSGSGAALTTNTVADFASVSLTAGDWDIEAEAWFLAGSGTTATYFEAYVSQDSATLISAPALAAARNSFFASEGISNSIVVLPLVRVRASLSGTTTFYVSGRAGFAVSTLTGHGKITARRVR